MIHKMIHAYDSQKYYDSKKMTHKKIKGRRKVNHIMEHQNRIEKTKCVVFQYFMKQLHLADTPRPRDAHASKNIRSEFLGS